jgi:hypothetical protein
MPQKLWIPGEEVVADDLNDYLQNQTVAQFASTAERDADWPSPPSGAFCFIGRNLYEYVDGVWFTPFRRVGFASTTSNSTAASAETVVLTIAALTLPANRLIKVEARWRAMTGGAGEACTLRIREGTTTAGTQVGDYVANILPSGAQASSASGGTFTVAYTVVTGGSGKQWVLTSQSSTANNVQVLASATSPTCLSVIDQGAV